LCCYAAVCLGVSCFFAVLVNISQYLCIGRFSAVSFQVIGHVKTCLVFFFGWVIFAAPVTERNIMGCSLAVVGMVYYSHAVTKAPVPEPAQAEPVSGPNKV
jgi:solute carrier family 35 protein E3